MASLSFDVDEESAGTRADRFLQNALRDEWSRTDVQRWFDEGLVELDGKKIKKNHALRAGAKLVVADVPEKPGSDLVPEEIPLDVVYEDDDLLVIDKPKGLVVHPGSGVTTGTLAAALLWRCRENLSSVNGPLRPGIVHRLDKETSGLMVAAKTDAAHRGLAEQLRTHRLHRVYRAIAWGAPDGDEGVFEGNIGRDARNRLKMCVCAEGRPARTHWRVVERFLGTTELELKLETGRTHQIRVHLAHNRMPVVGDPLYRGREQALNQIQPMQRALLRPLLSICGSQALQAVELAFDHPTTGKEMRFSVPPETEIERAREYLRKITADSLPKTDGR